ncbi:MAG TPA: hypothetical protein VGU64_12080 [Terriglobales bacterium]|nr:hypothetical protein [Terriglobales bacterium]
MLKHTALVFLLLGLALSQTHPIEVHLDQIRGVKCKGAPKDFACAIFFDLDPPLYEGIGIANVVSANGNSVQTSLSVIRAVSVILDSTLYTAVYDPPVKRDDKISHLCTIAGIPARVDGEDLFIQWPDGEVVKGKIVRREKIKPNRVQPA